MCPFLGGSSLFCYIPRAVHFSLVAQSRGQGLIMIFIMILVIKTSYGNNIAYRYGRYFQTSTPHHVWF